MSSRLAYFAALTIVLMVGMLRAEILEVVGQPLYTLNYLRVNGVMTDVDTTQSDTVYTVRLSDSSRVYQIKFVYFLLPSSVVACSSFYVEARSIYLGHRFRTGLILQFFPLEFGTPSDFVFEHNDFWVQYYTIDTVNTGDSILHRTTEGLDEYNRFTLHRDYPDATFMVLGLRSNYPDDTLRVIDATLYWEIEDVAVREPRRAPAGFVYSVSPNPLTDGFQYDGPSAEFVLYDLLGRRVESGTLRPQNWQKLDNIPPGTYFLQIDNAIVSHSIRLVKVR